MRCWSWTRRTPSSDPNSATCPGSTCCGSGTLSKTLGSLGGFVAGPQRFVDLLVNRARPYIFTTAPTPADAGAALAALGVLRSDEGAALRARLVRLVARVAAWSASPTTRHRSCPWSSASEADAVAASASLLERGLWVPAIRPPTVPPGTSRLRITLSATHTDQQVDRLLDGLAGLGPETDRGRGVGSAA